MDAPAGAGIGKGWLRRLAGYCWRYPRLVILSLGGALLATAVAAAIPLIQRDIVDNAILAHRQPIWPGATLLIVAAVLSFCGVYLRRYLGGRVSLDVQHDLRTELFGSLSRLDGARQDQLHTGQIVSRSISDLTMIQGLLGMVPMMLSSGVLFVLSVVIMAFLSPLLTLIALAIGPALWVIALASRRRLFPASWDAQQQAANVAGVVDGAVTGVRVVKGFGQEEQEIERVEEASGFLYASRVRAVRLMARFNPVLQAVPALGQVGVLALGGWLAIRHEISIGTFFAFSAYLAQMVGPVRALAGMITIGQEARASVIRVYEVIDSRPVLTEKPGAIELPPGTPDVELDDVTFGYVPSQPVLRGLSLRVRPGETLAVVGTSGSGKSTISLLLPRFYDVRGGAVRVGGCDVRDLTLDSLRASIGLVMEESFLFSDTVRANIAYGRPGATEEQIVAAARAAEADEFITGLADGYDTVVGEQGLTLSGGQRQRVALARALITDPSILVLDDATSAIDARVEAQIHATLRRVMAGRTTLLIAHRRSTLQLADRIAVLDEGRLVDEGTHEELTARCPLYRLLLAGPGDDAEGIDAGELGCYSDDASRRAADLAAEADGVLRPAAGVTPSLWPGVEFGNGHEPGGDDPGPPAGASVTTSPRAGSVMENSSPDPAAAAPGRSGMRPGYGARARETQRGGGAAATSMLADVPPTPELLARVDALPPATDAPNVSRSWARAADPHFTLRRLLKPFAVALVAGLLLDGLDALASLAMPLLVRGGIDNGVLAGAVHSIILVALGALAIVLADWAVNTVQTVVVGRNGERLLYSLRVKIFSQLQRLGLDYYERELAGRIMTRMTTDVDALSSFLQTGLITMVNSGLSFIGVLIAMLYINLKLGLTLLSIMPVLVAATVVFRAKSSRAYREAREKVSAVNADLQENVAGLRVAQAYRREQVNSAHFAGLSGAYLSSRLRAQRYIALYFPFVQALSTLGGALVLFVASSEVHSGALTAGSLIAYLLFIDLLFSPVQQLSQVFDGFQQANVGLQRIKSLLRTPTSTPQARSPVPVTGRLRGEIELRDVHFSYPGQKQEALGGVSLSIAPGETVALVGQTGAGKSTLVKLIARFYDLTSGRLLVDGVDVRDYDLASYRHQLGVVPQEPYLFAGTVRDAIAYGRPGATDAEVEAAARGVGAIEMIARLPGGFGHEVSERGRNLSAGQRQLIALARAYLVDPAILLLDEATAALDLAAEAEVSRATEQLAARRTTLVVAHRLTTASRADRIVVVESGRLAESGTHDELLEAGGSYAAMWAAFTGDAELVA
ncbi:MAG TPA: ABC transporter transmembrane domain-containing protein [Streptosporangiaceae bacterium]|nr:ABC transporter transmembrane domain-containing protein [Streptosporangiaceae bacterium]